MSGKDLDVDTMENIIQFISEICDSNGLIDKGSVNSTGFVVSSLDAINQNIANFKLSLQNKDDIEVLRTNFNLTITRVKYLLNPPVGTLPTPITQDEHNIAIGIIKRRVYEKTKELKDTIDNSEAAKQKIISSIELPFLKDDLSNPYIRDIYANIQPTEGVESVDISETIATTVKNEAFRFYDFAKMMSDAKYETTMERLAEWITEENLKKLNDDLKKSIALDTQNIDDTIGELTNIFTRNVPTVPSLPAPAPAPASLSGGIRKRRTPRNKRKNKRTRRHYN